MNGNRGAFRRATTFVLFVLALCLVPGTAHAGKAETGAKIGIDASGVGQYQYTVKVTSDKRSCRKRRDVTVWHDTNKNGKLDKGEFIIGEGKTNRRGKLIFLSSAIPPEGDFVGVYVSKTDRCRKFEDSIEILGSS